MILPEKKPLMASETLSDPNIDISFIEPETDLYQEANNVVTDHLLMDTY